MGIITAFWAAQALFPEYDTDPTMIDLTWSYVTTRACHQIGGIGFKRVDFPGPTALAKGLKPLAPHDQATQESGFQGLDDSPSPRVFIGCLSDVRRISMSLCNDQRNLVEATQSTRLRCNLDVMRPNG